MFNVVFQSTTEFNFMQIKQKNSEIQRAERTLLQQRKWGGNCLITNKMQKHQPTKEGRDSSSTFSLLTGCTKVMREAWSMSLSPTVP